MSRVITCDMSIENDGRFLFDIPELPGCTVYGDTHIAGLVAVLDLAKEILTDRVKFGEEPLESAHVERTSSDEATGMENDGLASPLSGASREAGSARQSAFCVWLCPKCGVLRGWSFPPVANPHCTALVQDLIGMFLGPSSCGEPLIPIRMVLEEMKVPTIERALPDSSTAPTEAKS